MQINVSKLLSIWKCLLIFFKLSAKSLIFDPSLPGNKLHKIIEVDNCVNFSSFSQTNNKYIRHICCAIQSKSISRKNVV